MTKKPMAEFINVDSFIKKLKNDANNHYDAGSYHQAMGDAIVKRISDISNRRILQRINHYLNIFRISATSPFKRSVV